MFKKDTIGRRSDFVTGLLLVAVAVLFTLSFASSAGAHTFPIQGKVVAFDDKAGTLTLNPSGTSDEMVFNMGDASALSSYARDYGRSPVDTAVTMCEQFLSAKDLKIGDEVTVNYNETSNGHWIAEEINIASPQC